MPEWIIAFFSALGDAAESIVGRVLIALGVQATMYTGLDALLGEIVGGFQSAMTGVPSQVANYISYFKLDQALSIIMSAVTARWTLHGLTSGAITRFILK